MQELLSLLNSIVKLSPEDERLIQEHWAHDRSILRNEYLIEKDSLDYNLYFVAEGSLRIFYPNDGEEICVGFGYTNTLLVSFQTFLRDLPSDYYVQALKKTKLSYIKREDFLKLRQASENIDRLWNKAMEEALIGKIERETEMLTFSPQQRLERLFKRSPHIFQIIPRKHIASYLGMTPETLSRIRLNVDSNQ